MRKIGAVIYSPRKPGFFSSLPFQLIFFRYINKYQKLKVEKSGWPPHVKTEEERLKFIEDYEREEVIILDSTGINFNAGQRELGKLMLNSFWGKVSSFFHFFIQQSFFQFGQRSNLVKTKLVKSAAQMWETLIDSSIKLCAIVDINDAMLLLKYRTAEPEFEDIMTNTNVVIAAFTTAHARLKLYSFMEALGDRVLYTDTGTFFLFQPFIN